MIPCTCLLHFIICYYHYRGVLPYTERKGVINHFQDKNRSSSGGTSLFGRGNQIQEGSQVCLRSRPIYSSGCKAVYIKGDSVVCGELLESVLIMSDKCRFKILPMGGADDTEPMDTETEERVNQPGPSTGTCTCNIRYMYMY